MTISGRVVDVNGNSVSGASVSLHTQYETPEDMSFSDYLLCQEVEPDGSFVMEGLGEGSYGIWAGCEGYNPPGMKIVSAGTKGLLFTLTKQARIHISGKVVDAQTGELISGAIVGFIPSVTELSKAAFEMERTKTSSENGYFELNESHEGEFTLMARAENYQPLCQSYDKVQQDTLNGAVLKLQRGLALSGRVINTSGEPLPGVYVFAGLPPNPAFWKYEGSARTQSTIDGTFTITTLSPDDEIISAVLAEYPPAIVNIPDMTSGRATVDIVIPDEAGRVEGVVTVNGQPMSGWRFTVCTDPVMRSISYTNDSADVNGKYEVRNLPEAACEVEASGRIPGDMNANEISLSQNCMVTPGKTTLVDFNYSTGETTVEIHILDMEGNELKGDIVIFMNNGPLELKWYINDDWGKKNYHFYNLPEGDAKVSVWSEGEYARQYIEHIQIPASGTLRHDIVLSR